MSWLKRKIDGLGKRKDADRRIPRRGSLSQIEQLESRLCLGSLNSPDVGDWTPDDPHDDSLEAAQLESDLSQEESSYVEPDEGVTPTPTPTGTESGGSTTGTTGSTGGTFSTLGLGLDANQTDSGLNGESTPVVDPQAGGGYVGSSVAEEDDTPESMGAVNNTGEGSSGEAGPDGGEQAVTDDNFQLTSDTLVQQAGAGGFGSTEDVHLPPWWQGMEEPVTIKYDFRDLGEFQNYISDDQKALAEEALSAWAEASGGLLQFVHDTEAGDHEIMNIGTGELEAFGYASGAGGTLGLGGGAVSQDADGDIVVAGNAWLDVTENWDHEIGNGDPENTTDFFTVVGHETGHVLGFHDSQVYTADQNIMRGFYDSERSVESFQTAANEGTMYTGIVNQAPEDATYTMRAMTMAQLTAPQVSALLARASAATSSDDAIIAVVDRGGTILGVHVEAGVIRNIDDPTNDAIARFDVTGGTRGDGNGVINTEAERRALAFFADGAVAKARTAAFFSNGDPTNIDEQSPIGTRAPLTSRLVRFISQTTITQREVEGIASIDGAIDPTLRGPGYIAPIGLGGHFPPEIRHTPPVDLFAIEHTNRDRVVGDASATVANAALLNNFNPANPFGTSPNVIDTTAFVPMVNNRTVNGQPVNANQDPAGDPVAAGDVLRFNIDQANVNPTLINNGQLVNAADALREPLSFGEISGLDPNARSRGIATLPGGIPIFRDVNPGPGGSDAGIGDTLIGGIGVFFPGRDGFATFEQGFKPGVEQAEFERTNAPKVLEAEFMALIAINGSMGAAQVGIPLAKTDIFAGTALDARMNGLGDIDLPFGRLDLVGISLQVIGPEASRQGVGEVILRGLNLGTGPVSGNQIYAPANVQGREVPFGFIVPPRGSADGLISANQVNQIIQNAINGANQVRAAVRLPVSSRTRMVFAVSDLQGNILALFRMQDATVFSIDVAVAKARNTAYYANAAELQPQDTVAGIPPGTAFTNRTFRFLAEPRFPSGVDGDPPGPYSTLNNPFIDPFTGTNLGAPAADTAYLDTVLGRNSFNPTAPGVQANTNFADPNNPNNQNGIVFFPGSTPLYSNGQLIGGFGVSGDGVDQDDVVTFIGAQGFLPNQNGVLRSDQTRFRDVRLPYQKFLRNPFG